MLSLLLAASMGGYPACQAATGYAGGYGAQSYVATPYVQNYATSYAAPTYYQKVVTAFVPVAQVDAYRTEIVGDQARAVQYAASRLQADTNLVNAITGLAANLDKFRAQVDAATKVQDQAFQAKQYQPPPVAQYPVQPSPQSPAPPTKAAPDYGQVPEPPQASFQAPSKGFPTLPPANVPPPPTDVPQGDPGTFPTQPQQGFQSQPQATQPGTLSPTMQAATQIIGQKCGACHTGPNGSGGFAVLASKDRLASYDANFLRMLDQVAYRGYVLKPDGTKLKMPPNGRSMSAEEYGQIHAMFDEADQAATLASNAQGAR